MKLFGVNVANGYFSKISGACNVLNCVLLLWETEFCIYAFSPGRNYILCSYWAAVPVLVYWTMKKHGHEIDLE